MRLLTALLLIPMTACVTTSSYGLDQIPREGLKTEAGELTVIEENGDQATFSGPVTLRDRGAQLRVERELLPTATFTTDKVARLEVATPSPGKTAALAIGIVAVVGALVVFSAMTSQRANPTLPPLRFDGPLY